MGFRSKVLGVQGQGWSVHGTAYPRPCFLLLTSGFSFLGCIDLEEMLLEQNNNNNIGNRKIGDTLNRIPLYQLQNKWIYNIIHRLSHVHVSYRSVADEL
jgi:hypothetical protein